MILVQLKILDERIRAYGTPDYATAMSSGIDLRACISEEVIIPSGKTTLVPSGIAIHINNEWLGAFIFPRSGLGHKDGLVLGNSTGVVDADYQGEIKISLWNRNFNKELRVQPMDRVAQLVFLPITKIRLVETDGFDESARGDHGFGSTGNQ